MRERMDTQMAALEADLTTLAGAVTYPPTPDLAAAFWRHLEASRAPSLAASPLSFAGLALSTAVVVISILIGVAAPVRDAAADLFDRINIFETTQSTEGLPADITGEEATLDDAEFALGRAILLPDDLDPTRILTQDFGPSRVVAVFFEHPGTDTPFVLFASNVPVGKGLPQDGAATSEPVEVAGSSEAYWLTGERIVQYYDFDDEVIPESVRTTDANALIWEVDGEAYKIEGALTQEQAIDIAESLGVTR